MPDEWIVPEIVENEDGSFSVQSSYGGVSIDMTDVSDPDQVEEVEDAFTDDIFLDVSGGDVTGVHMSYDDFVTFVSGLEDPQDVSENDPEADPEDPISLLAVEGDDVSTTSFNPQQWQVNMAENRPLGWHYVMTRTGTNTNNYILVLGRDITYADGFYTYTDADFYSVYSTGSSSNLRYHYDVHDHWTGTISASTYVVYSDLYFDYLGGRSLSYVWFVLSFLVVAVLFLIFFRGNRN